MPRDAVEGVLLLIGVAGVLLARPAAEMRGGLTGWSDERVKSATGINRRIAYLALGAFLVFRVFT